MGIARGSERAAAVRRLGAMDVVGSVEEGGRYDVVLESVGGSSLESAVRALAKNGRIVSIGCSSEEASTIHARDLYRKGGSILGFLLFDSRWRDRIRHDLEWLLEEVAAGRLQVPIAGTYPFSDVDEALGLLRDRRAPGKVILVTP